MATTTKTKKKVELPPNPFIHEILERASKQRSKAKKVEILQEYENDALKSIFIWNFDETVISVLPAGDVPFNKNEVPVGTDHTSLRREYKHLYNFVRVVMMDSLDFVGRLCSFKCLRDFILRRQNLFAFVKIKDLQKSTRSLMIL